MLAYVILDGFDLGVGILFPFVHGEADRDVMMNSVAPVWDGNETWLVLGGGGLFAVFPLAYAVIMPALYAPIIAMLLALIFRGVAFEFRWRTRARQVPVGLGVRRRLDRWRRSRKGVALGALVQGIPVANRAYAGGWWDWLTPFSLLTGVALVVGYALLGATWLVYKTEGEVQREAYRFAVDRARSARWLLIGVVSLWTPFLEPDLHGPLVRLAAAALHRPGAAAGRRRRASCCSAASPRSDELTPFLAALALFVLSYVGLGISFYPYIVPASVTIWEAAAPDNSLGFLLVGAAVLVPLILLYTAYSYWVFRGKVNAAGGYH